VGVDVRFRIRRGSEVVHSRQNATSRSTTRALSGSCSPKISSIAPAETLGGKPEGIRPVECEKLVRCGADLGKKGQNPEPRMPGFVDGLISVEQKPSKTFHLDLDGRVPPKGSRNLIPEACGISAAWASTWQESREAGIPSETGPPLFAPICAAATVAVTMAPTVLFLAISYDNHMTT
jgi:hypothetical protein